MFASLAWAVASLCAQAQESASRVCPSFLPEGAQCWSGRSSLGGYYWIAMPKAWNGVMVVHAHGGPRLGAPKPDDPLEDLERFSSTVREGFAWAGSTYRRGGYGVRMAAEDTEDLRKIVWEKFGRPRRTLVHGQSWGGNVAAKLAELYARDAEGQVIWDGVVTTSGALGGGTRAYTFRADLRAVYQYYCHNLPGPGEPAYPLWQGLSANSKLTRKDLEARVEACTGVGLPAARRTALQKRNLADILAVVDGVEEAELVAHLAWATFTFRDLTLERLGGLNPFDNMQRRYTGSHDDNALNAGVARFQADPEAVARLAYDSDLSGLIVAPTITLHAKHDPTLFVWHEAMYRETVARAARSQLLVQAFTNEHEHSRLSPPQFAAALTAMVRWLDQGEKPTAGSLAKLCAAVTEKYAAPCFIDENFQPAVPRQ